MMITFGARESSALATSGGEGWVSDLCTPKLSLPPPPYPVLWVFIDRLNVASRQERKRTSSEICGKRRQCRLSVKV